ncbi:hypothetical protein [Thermoplasma volcanium GSS1]|uniref:Glycosyltransferase 2-like domain-containing protein n=1 Tax=Thermoplasma volcanium (strain ATCC 51530 / DSM 4299 / JCM 9571 / NBRC 15438 / GSS1) TaxID=273116 RepID=Q97CK7_THEVO|nr:glycosyltransferase family 2 protein [Thermoplasma volcanium]BAB59236.1 hypothetical protein [Thermoplasma volcanium GSS1]
MLLSVIITAQGRKGYVMQAVRSVLSQNIPKEDFEIIVSKDFKDDVIDEFLDGRAIVLNENHIRSGSRVASAVLQSSGKILVFLDDDDLFYPGKLREVKIVFSEMGVDYFKNSVKPVAESGDTVSYYQPAIKSDIFVKEPNEQDIRKLLKLRAGFNSSSISLKKDILVGYLDVLSKINLAVDSFYFFLYMSHSRPIYYSKKTLSLYRVLSKSTSRDVRNINAYAEFKSKFYELYSRDFETISEMASDGPCSKLAKTEFHLQMAYKWIFNTYRKEERPRMLHTLASSIYSHDPFIALPWPSFMKKIVQRREYFREKKLLSENTE